MPAKNYMGYTYPTPDDQFGDEPETIQQLTLDIAQRVGVIASGTATIHVAAAPTGDLAINFPAGRFTAPPVISVTTLGNAAYYGCAASGGLTKDGFTARVAHRDGSNATADIPIHWIAVQQG